MCTPVSDIDTHVILCNYICNSAYSNCVASTRSRQNLQKLQYPSNFVSTLPASVPAFREVRFDNIGRLGLGDLSYM